MTSTPERNRRGFRLPDPPVSACRLPGHGYLHHPTDGILEVQSGVTSEHQFVHATIAEPRRWFMELRSVEAPHGVWALMLWEVDPATGQRALKRRAQGDANAAPVIDALAEVKISSELEWTP